MSLTCDETGKMILFGQALYAGTREDKEFYCALSQEALDHIPEFERRLAPCDPEEGGVDIHASASVKDLATGGYKPSTGFHLKEFLFSVSRSAAERYLPNHLKKYNP